MTKITTEKKLGLLILLVSLGLISYLCTDKTFQNMLVSFFCRENAHFEAQIQIKKQKIQQLNSADKQIFKEIGNIYSEIPPEYKKRLSKIKMLNQSSTNEISKKIKELVLLSEIYLDPHGDLILTLEIIEEMDQVYILGYGETRIQKNRIFEASGQFPKKNPDSH